LKHYKYTDIDLIQTEIL